MEQLEILSNMRKVLRSINLESKRIQKEHGISIPQLLCLNFLMGLTSLQSSVREISANLNLNPSTISGIVKRLEIKGYIAKLPNPQDRRGSIIALTQKGASLVKSSPTLLHLRLAKNLERLSEIDLQTVQRGTRLLVKCMGVEDFDPSPMVTEVDMQTNGEQPN